MSLSCCLVQGPLIQDSSFRFRLYSEGFYKSISRLFTWNSSRIGKRLWPRLVAQHEADFNPSILDGSDQVEGDKYSSQRFSRQRFHKTKYFSTELSIVTREKEGWAT